MTMANKPRRTPAVTQEALGPEPAPWKSGGPNLVLAGQAHIDHLDAVAAAIEARWGVGRLRLLVPPDMAAAFDRQRMKLNAAIWTGDFETLRQECMRMEIAWRTLDDTAKAAGAEPLSPSVLAEVVVDGTVVAIVPDAVHAHAVQADGRRRQCWTLDEVATALAAFPALVKAKATFPGATVEPRRRNIGDPLNGVELEPDLTPETRNIGFLKRDVDYLPAAEEIDDAIPW